MVKLEKLEKEVQRLPPGELALFRRWFRKFDSAAWDQQIVKDARSGKLDKIAGQVGRARGCGFRSLRPIS